MNKSQQKPVNKLETPTNLKMTDLNLFDEIEAAVAADPVCSHHLKTTGQSLKGFIDGRADAENEDLLVMDLIVSVIAEKAMGIKDLGHNELRMVDARAMLHNYYSVGLPGCVPYWRDGFSLFSLEKQHESGKMGLAYEMVINSNPCIAYEMKSNSRMMQALVIAHASYGHHYVFDNNYVFKQFTNPDAIMDEVAHGAQNLYPKAVQKHTEDFVQRFWDAVQTIEPFGVSFESMNRMNTPWSDYSSIPKDGPKTQKEKQKAREDRKIENYTFDDELDRALPEQKSDEKNANKRLDKDITLPTSDLYYFLEKESPFLAKSPELRELLRHQRKISEYFFPQKQTNLLHEAFATFSHYYMMRMLYSSGIMTDKAWAEFTISHTGVVTQLTYNQIPNYNPGINVYALGFAMLTDVYNAVQYVHGYLPAETATEKALVKEYQKCYKHLLNEFPKDGSGMEAMEAVKYIVRSCNNSEFVQGYLSPKVSRDFSLFEIDFDPEDPSGYEVIATNEAEKYTDKLRRDLADEYSLHNRTFNISVSDVDFSHNNALTLVYEIIPDNDEYSGLQMYADADPFDEPEEFANTMYLKRLDSEETPAFLKQLHFLWAGDMFHGCAVNLEERVVNPESKERVLLNTFTVQENT